jgi:hypothetical protein
MLEQYVKIDHDKFHILSSSSLLIILPYNALQLEKHC